MWLWTVPCSARWPALRDVRPGCGRRSNTVLLRGRERGSSPALPGGMLRRGGQKGSEETRGHLWGGSFEVHDCAVHQEGEKLQDYLQEADNKALKNIIKRCEGRACAFNNRETGQGRENQATVLLTMALELTQSHGGHGYPHKWKNVSSKIIRNAREKYESQNPLKNLKDRLS